MALAFDRSDMFAIDKAAGEPCPNLNDEMRCKIHANLDDNGFQGCIRYGCLGAGQRVSQQVFHGDTWRNDPALLTPMLDAFRAMRRVHELLELLQTAGGLRLNDDQKTTLSNLMETLMPDSWTTESLTAFESGPIGRDVQVFLTSFREQVSRT